VPLPTLWDTFSALQTQPSISGTFRRFLHGHKSLVLCIWKCMNLRQGCIIKLWKRNNLLVKLCSENVRNGAPASSHEVCDMKGEGAYRSPSILSVLTLWVVATSFPPVRSISCIPVNHKVRMDLKAKHKRLTSITDNCTFNHWNVDPFAHVILHL